MRSKVQVILGVMLLSLLIPMAASAQSGSGLATAVVQETIQVQAVADLDFGSLVPTQVPGNVIVTSGGATSSTDVFVTSPGSPAQWNVTGLANETYAITLPSAATLRLDISPGTTMLAVNFEHNAGPTPALDATGNDSFDVGAQLNVGANQPDGNYSGNYTVTVAYN